MAQHTSPDPGTPGGRLDGVPARPWHWARLSAGIVFVLVVGLNAWVCDDAYISFRVVDNLHHGLGLRWNPVERVQVFTHPAWLVLVAFASWFGHNIYLTVLIVSVALAGLLVWLVGWKVATRADDAAVVLVAMSMSAALVDYSTSGLENPLLNVLLGVLCWLACRADNARHSLAIVGCRAVAVLARPDALVVVAPVVGWSLWQARPKLRLRALLLGMLPLVVWSVFATVYYGSPVPNSVLAKINTGIPIRALLHQGAFYLYESALHDPVTIAVIVVGTTLGLARRGADRALAIGVVLSLMLVLRVGGDFMAGRFVVTPFVIAAVLAVRSTPRRNGLHIPVIVALVVLGVPAPRSPFLPPTDDTATWHGISDERAVYSPTTGIMSVLALGGTEPFHPWVEAGRQYRAHSDGDVVVTYNVGFMGFYGGAGVHLVDVFALTDPVLSRLPVTEASGWRPGHFERELPPGYLEGIRSGTFAVADPALQPLVHDLRRLSNSRPLDREWWRACARLWCGRWAPQRRRQTALAAARTQAAVCFDRGDFEASVGFIERAIAIDPARSRSWWWLARAQRAGDRPDAALAAVRAALRLDAWNLAARQLEAQPLVESGGDAWRELLDRTPAVLEADLTAAARLIDRGRAPVAVALLRASLGDRFEVCRFRDAPRTRGALAYRRELESTAHQVLAIALDRAGNPVAALQERELAQALAQRR